MTHVEPEVPATISAALAAAPQASGPRVVALDCYDVRFPTSLTHDGSDAMNPDPDYSAAYAVLRTDREDLAGAALCFTIGRGSRRGWNRRGDFRLHMRHLLSSKAKHRIY